MPRMLGDEMDFRKLGVCGCGQVHRNELDVRVVPPKRQLQNPDLLRVHHEIHQIVCFPLHGPAAKNLFRYNLRVQIKNQEVMRRSRCIMEYLEYPGCTYEPQP